ncbi:class I SAM-dependent DNA methyltransferase, partial [Nocardioides sp.]|uniref:class I SAM-dependent DNA methyltransferase n=1 Tax=Nocardioides sp. TaxID=35761 RepID=UPI0035162FC5
MESTTPWPEAAALIADHGEAGWSALLTAVTAHHGRPVPVDTWGLAVPAGASDLTGMAAALVREPVPAGPGGSDVGAALARLHLALLGDRDRRGAFYTPPDLADWLVARALAGAPAATSVLDPACGAGDLLLAARRRGVPSRALHGTDLDPVAVAVARLRLLLADPAADVDDVVARLRVADGLGEHPAAPVDVVLGNPPFLGRLRAATATTATGGLGAYTDAAAVFLHRALDLVAPGGRIAMVQPVSVLAARDAVAVRSAVLDQGRLLDLWVEPVTTTAATGPFPGLHVQTCAVVVERGPVTGRDGPADAVGDRPRVRVWSSYARGARGRLRPAPRDAAGWAALGARAGRVEHRVPAVRPRTRGVLGDLATITADFRDEYYGLVPHVREAAELEDPEAPRAWAPLVTSGLIDPARCGWGRRPARFARRTWQAPAVAPADLPEPLAGWARSRLVPKVLVAPQGRVVEAVADPEGRWLPSVPVISVVPVVGGPEDPPAWARALAVLLAPTTSALLAARLHGSGLQPGAVRFSARHRAAVPLPADQGAWDDAARLFLAHPAPAPVDVVEALLD